MIRGSGGGGYGFFSCENFCSLLTRNEVFFFPLSGKGTSNSVLLNKPFVHQFVLNNLSPPKKTHRPPPGIIWSAPKLEVHSFLALHFLASASQSVETLLY